MAEAAGRIKTLHLGDRIVDLATGRVDGPVPARLTGLEVALLGCLARAGDEPVGREALLQEAWGYRSGHSWRAVDAAIYRLRKKIEIDANDPRWLLTVRGGGYRLVRADEGEAGSAGRTAEREAVAVAVRAGGLVSVVGLPGVGRTWVVDRALQEGARPGAPLRIDAGRGTDATALLHRALLAAGVSATAAVDADGLRAALHAALGDGSDRVVVLDRADGNGPAARAFAERLLAACPRLAVLVVADSALEAPGETTIPIRPLDPAAARAFLLERLPRGADADAAGLDALLRALAGIPLALALAADCLAWCSPADLARQLERGIGLLDLPARRSGRAGLAALWGHAWENLPEEGRAALRALLPFVGGVTLATIEQVAGSEGVQAVLDLVGRGWIQRGEARDTYRLHPVLRSFLLGAVGIGADELAGWVRAGAAAARRVEVPVGDLGRWAARRALAETGVAGELTAIAHAAPPGEDLAYVALAAETWLDGRSEPSARRAVLDRALAVDGLPPPLVRRLRIARARLELGWGDWDDARRRIDALLAEIPADTEPGARAWLLWYRHGGQIAGTAAEQLAAAREARRLAPAAGDPVLEGIVLLFEAVAEWQSRTGLSVDAVDATLQRAGALMSGAGELSGAAYAELHRSFVLQESGRAREAAHARRRAAEFDAASPDHLFRGGVLAHRAMDRALAHDLEGASAALREALAVDLAAGMTANRPFLLQKLALYALDRGALEEAERAAAESLSAARGADGRRLVNPLDSYVLAVVALERGEAGAAVHLARGAVADAGAREALLLDAVAAYGAARAGLPATADPLGTRREEPLDDRLSQAAAVWLVGARLARGDRAAAEALLRRLDAVDLALDYADILRHRLRRAVEGPDGSVAPAPPPGAPPPDERSVLLRFAGHWDPRARRS